MPDHARSTDAALAAAEKAALAAEKARDDAAAVLTDTQTFVDQIRRTARMGRPDKAIAKDAE